MPAGAHARTLRVSLLQRCQYDCAYCRPGTVAPKVRREALLTVGEYKILAPLFGEAGVEKVRFTGGEPLLRTDLTQLVAAFHAALPTADLAVTTNGQLLGAKLPELARAGLRRATVHVDTLDPIRYRALMGDGELPLVLASVLEAKALLEQVKLNVVVQRGRNDDELGRFLEWSSRHGIEVRFIEQMNTGSARAYTRETFFSGREILARVGEVERLPRRDAADPAALYRTADGVVFGVIASDTEPFCGACNRLRLTCDGLLRGCLYQAGGVPVGAAVRGGASASGLRDMIRAAAWDKRSHHPLRVVAGAPFSMAEAGG